MIQHSFSTMRTVFMRHAVLSLLIIFSPHVLAEWAGNHPVGSAFPDVTAQDQTNKKWTNHELIGANGLIFFVNRSTSW